jgi:hypothetical protein
VLGGAAIRGAALGLGVTRALFGAFVVRPVEIVAGRITIAMVDPGASPTACSRSNADARLERAAWRLFRRRTPESQPGPGPARRPRHDHAAR